MNDPVMVATGHTYDRVCIERWLQQGNRTCPVTGMRLRHLELTPNFALRNAIQVTKMFSAMFIQQNAPTWPAWTDVRCCLYGCKPGTATNVDHVQGSAHQKYVCMHEHMTCRPTFCHTLLPCVTTKYTYILYDLSALMTSMDHILQLLM